MKDGYILRHVGETVPGLYRDLPDGAPPSTRLFQFTDDPAEASDISSDMPEILNSMQEIYRNNTADFPPPYQTGLEKWKEINNKEP